MTDETWDPLVRDQLTWQCVPTDYQSFEYARWLAGVESVGESGLARPCGEAEGPYAEDSLARLVLHINRELIHHLAEVCLLRDLYLHTRQQTRQEAS